MVLASAALYGDRLRAAVDVFGISNVVTFLKNAQDYRRDLRRATFGTESMRPLIVTALSLFARHSPTF